MSAKTQNGVETARLRYVRARNKFRSLLRIDTIYFERGIALQSKSNRKAFWAHTRQKLKTKNGVAPLFSNPKDKDSMEFDDEEKANILQQQFTSVFTREQEGEIEHEFDDRTNTEI